MMKNLIGFFTVSLMCISQNVLATVSVVEYQNIIEKAQTIYQDDFNQKGLKLLLPNKWDDETQNGYTQRLGNRNIISLLGGLARNKFMSRDSLALVACSEIGLSLGEFPQRVVSLPSGFAMSLRGQADYFGTAKCLKKFFSEEDNKSIVLQKNVPAIVERLCSFSFLPNSNDKYICIRSAIAGDELANVLNSTSREEDQIQISLSTPSKTVVDTTSKDFPDIQCRLDTYFAGALCNSANSSSQIKDGYCHGNDLGSRPLCWFKPSDEE